MEAAKSAILDLLVDAYQRRDRVGLVSFRGDDAELVLSPTASVELAQMKLQTLPTGGSTPLAHGLRASLEVLESERRRNTETIPWLVLVTDGRANVGLDGGLGSDDARTWAEKVRGADVNVVVVDTDTGDSPVTIARDLARIAQGEYVRLAEISGPAVARAVKTRLERS
jgi:magnesium chelatase subunit D